MDLSAIIVIVVLTSLSLAAIVGLEVYSRKNQPKESGADQLDNDMMGNPEAISGNGVERGVKT